MTMKKLEKILRQHFGDKVLRQTKAGLAVIATLALKNTQPTTLVFCGPSGSGKTLTCSFLTPDEKHEKLNQYIIRVDKFTPKSFVSHVGNVEAEKLPELDLLPKIENKCLITKELAPLFRGQKDELQSNFSILISVLDGKGLVTASGMRGKRGYERNINFSWLGATTPLTNEVHRLMAQLGTRILFYNTDSKPLTEAELVQFAERDDVSEAEGECRSACNEFLKRFFKKHPPRTLEERAITFPKELLWQLVRYVNLMTYLRAAFSMYEDRDGLKRFSRPEREDPFRAITILKNIAYGSALIHGRMIVTEDDLEQVRHIAFSSMLEQRRQVFQALLEYGGTATTEQICQFANMSKPTALHWMEELAHLGVVDFEKGGCGKASIIVLRGEFKLIPYTSPCQPVSARAV